MPLQILLLKPPFQEPLHPTFQNAGPTNFFFFISLSLSVSPHRPPPNQPRRHRPPRLRHARSLRQRPSLVDSNLAKPHAVASRLPSPPVGPASCRNRTHLLSRRSSAPSSSSLGHVRPTSTRPRPAGKARHCPLCPELNPMPSKWSSSHTMDEVEAAAAPPALLAAPASAPRSFPPPPAPPVSAPRKSSRPSHAPWRPGELAKVRVSSSFVIWLTGGSHRMQACDLEAPLELERFWRWLNLLCGPAIKSLEA